jgi:hypothetical protein
MTITGNTSDTANSLINQYLLEFEGEPKVTDNGSIIYFFPELLRTAQSLERKEPAALKNPERKMIVPFNGNPKKTNAWIAFFNGFNLLFGSYFIYFSAYNPELWVGNLKKITIGFPVMYQFIEWFTRSVEGHTSYILIGLGIVPLIFLFLFYLVPFLRNLRRKKINNEIKEENFRKSIYSYILKSPLRINPAVIVPGEESEKVLNAGAVTEKIVKEIVGLKYGDVEIAPDGSTLYTIPELDREIKDVQEYRRSINLNDYAVGSAVFDSGE